MFAQSLRYREFCLVVMPTLVIFCTTLTKTDFEAEFLQTVEVQRDIYVLLPQQSTDRGRCDWLLLNASYGLVNASVKRQVIGGAILTDSGFRHAPLLPQLFVLRRAGLLLAIFLKIVDDLLFSGDLSTTDPSILAISARVELGTKVHGLSHLHYFYLKIYLHDNYATTVEGDEKVEGMAFITILRLFQRDLDALLTSGSTAFASLNSTVGWLGITTSPIFASFACCMHEIAPTASVTDFLSQSTELQVIQLNGSTAYFPRPTTTLPQRISVTLFPTPGARREITSCATSPGY